MSSSRENSIPATIGCSLAQQQQNFGGALTHDRVAELKEAFALFDTEGRGVISGESLRTVLRSVAPQFTETDVQRILKAADEDSSGNVDFSEFVTLMALEHEQPDVGQSSVSPVKDVVSYFRQFDINHTNSVTQEQFLQVMQTMGDALTAEEAQELLDDLQRLGCLRKGRVMYKLFAKKMLQEDENDLSKGANSSGIW